MPLAESVVREIAAIVGEDHARTDTAARIAYSYDATFQQYPPDIVVSPATTEEVAAVVRVAHREGIAVIARGAGTSLAGGTIPVDGGLVLNLARMNRLIEIDVANSCAVVEAGCVTAHLQRAAEQAGLFYPPDPASLEQATLGGNVACNAGGPRCLKYGVTKDYVLGMTAVLADGRVLRLGGKLLKNVTGYQIMQLIVGSEGTLAVVTELVLRLRPLPRVRRTAAAFFLRIDDASESVAAIGAAGYLPVAVELLDDVCMRVVEEHAHLGLPADAGAMLILEMDGNDDAAVSAELGAVAEVCRRHGATEVRVARSDAERETLWAARRGTNSALARLRPNRIGEDVVVPRAEVPAMVRRLHAISAEAGLPIAVFGHAGDGNLHPNILFDRQREGEMERVEIAAAAIFRAALALGGTLSGEHGIGTLKKAFLEEDLGPDTVAVMRAIKDALDPKGILNPHKVFPDAPGPAPAGFLATLPTLDGQLPG
ncbi:MAG: FAD-binding protein [Dehalococcoidia bacterium]|nr:FAD-binding protein [Dehalococcoidia bacterium]